MSEEYKFSKLFDPNRWDFNEPIKSPFNLEEMLRACPNLLAHWKENPFTFDLDENNRIIVRYIHMPSTLKINYGDSFTAGSKFTPDNPKE